MNISLNSNNWCLVFVVGRIPSSPKHIWRRALRTAPTPSKVYSLCDLRGKNAAPERAQCTGNWQIFISGSIYDRTHSLLGIRKNPQSRWDIAPRARRQFRSAFSLVASCAFYSPNTKQPLKNNALKTRRHPNTIIGDMLAVRGRKWEIWSSISPCCDLAAVNLLFLSRTRNFFCPSACEMWAPEQNVLKPPHVDLDWITHATKTRRSYSKCLCWGSAAMDFSNYSSPKWHWLLGCKNWPREHIWFNLLSLLPRPLMTAFIWEWNQSWRFVYQPTASCSIQPIALFMCLP